ncbi:MULTISPECIES: hypothetical protein [unclassified Geodermatophilus]|uniref:hypothetical protein n=1 Tax=unclassified Geodermatophilus TaxID=2637632 RepID=UPI003EEA8CA5
MSAAVIRCPECASPRVHHLWRADMAQLALIDQWKCLDATCGHRWDTTVTHAQLLDADAAGPAEGDEVPADRQDSDAMSDSG